MVQSFCVVNCCFCEAFQGQQVKKEKKWTCKMCGQKQSFRKIFAQGTGKECRLSVQKLNRIKGCVGKVKQKDEYNYLEHQQQFSEQDNPVRITSDSKWKQFISPEQDNKESDQEDLFTTEREIFNKHKGEKRKKMNSQTTLQQSQEYPRKIKRCDITTKDQTSSSNLWMNKCKETEHCLLNTDNDGTNKLSENYFESESKENEMNISFLTKNPSFSSLTKTSAGLTGCKPSKWSKFT